MNTPQTNLRMRTARRWPPLTLWNSYDLVLLLVLALVLPLLVRLPAQVTPLLAVLRVPLGVLAVVVAPGYALMATLFPRREDLDGQSRAALSIGLSLAAIAFLALVLGTGVWGIRPESIALSLDLWLVLFSAIAIVRRARLAALVAEHHPWMEVAAPLPTLVDEDASRAVHGRSRRSGGPGILLAVAALAVFAGATVLSIDRAPRTTEFYMLGEAGQAEYYPYAAAYEQPVTVTVGITNQERAERTYHIEVWAADAVPTANSGEQRRLAAVAPVTLAAGERRELPVTWQVPAPVLEEGATAAGGPRRIELRLFQGGEAAAYRHLVLWLDITPRAAVQP